MTERVKTYIITYVGFGPEQPAGEPDSFGVPIRNYPGELNALDDVAKQAIAGRESAEPSQVRLFAALSGGATNKIEYLLRKHRPTFQTEAESQGVWIAWFKYRKFALELSDF